MDAENLKITLDVTHANTTEAGPVKFAEELEENIAHVHVSDNTDEDEGNVEVKAEMPSELTLAMRVGE